jgi:hypothetical protein
MAAVLILALVAGFFVALSAMVLLGHGADSRDPEYSLGKVLAPRPASDADSR